MKLTIQKNLKIKKEIIRKFIRLNLPYCKSAKTNISKKFLKTAYKHF